MAKGSYIAVGENIHCTRVRLVTGKFVADLGGGAKALAFKDGGESLRLPVPASVASGDEWAGGKVRHVAVAIAQGMSGGAAERELGARYLRAMAREQEASGAWFLDLNVDEYSLDRAEKIEAMKWAAATVQAASTLPLSIDSSDSAILEAGLKACDPARGPALVNSVSLERASFIPIAAAAGACVIASAAGESSMPQSVEERLANVERLMGRLEAAGIPLDRTFLDPLVYTASVDTANPSKFIEAVRALRARYGKAVHFAPGLSNVSFGLPKRNVLNLAFARLCLDAGCDGGIVDPLQVNDAALAGIDFSAPADALARDLLLGKDEYCMNYIQAARA